MMRLLTFIAFALLAFLPGNAKSQCLKSEPDTVTLEGIVYAKDFPGPPNYQSIRSGDERMRYWILRLERPVCVEGDDFDNTRATHVRDLQLAFKDGSYYKKYRALVRRRSRFRVSGSLFHQESGHHVTKILVNVNRLTSARK